MARLSPNEHKNKTEQNKPGYHRYIYTHIQRSPHKHTHDYVAGHKKSLKWY